MNSMTFSTVPSSQDLEDTPLTKNEVYDFKDFVQKYGHPFVQWKDASGAFFQKYAPFFTKVARKQQDANRYSNSKACMPFPLLNYLRRIKWAVEQKSNEIDLRAITKNYVYIEEFIRKAKDLAKACDASLHLIKALYISLQNNQSCLVNATIEYTGK